MRESAWVIKLLFGFDARVKVFPDFGLVPTLRLMAEASFVKEYCHPENFI